MRFFWLVLLAFCCNAARAGCKDVQPAEWVDRKQLLADFKYLSSDALEGRKTGTAGTEMARQYLVQRFEALEISALLPFSHFLQNFTYRGNREGTNLVGWIEGSTHVDKFIVISAHYDHLGSKGRRIFNGADDNASGVAAALALASNIKKIAAKHSVIILLTDAEETGLYGAKAFVKDLPVQQSQIRLNLNLDMLSQPGRRWRLYATPSRRNTQLNDTIDKLIGHVPICLKRGHRSQIRRFSSVGKIDWHKASDHWAFGQLGIPYIFLGVGDHKLYHTERDTFERKPKRFYQAAVEAALAMFWEVDKQEWQR